MFTKKRITTILNIILILGFSFSNVFALSWFQSTTIKADQTATMKLSYSIANSDLNGAEVYKSLPFTEDKIRAAFTSDYIKIQALNVNKKKPDSTFVNIVISIKTITKLNSAPGFSNVKITWYKNADSTVFMYKADKNDNFSENVKASCTFELPTTEIMRSNGIPSGENKFSLQLKPENFKNGYNVFAVFKNSADTPDTKTTTGNDKKETEKGCGLFGFEMPFIIGLGMLFMRCRSRK